MSHHQYLGTNIVCDRMKRFIKHQDHVHEIQAVEQHLTQTNIHSMSITDFDQYVSTWGEVVDVLGSLYKNPIF